MNVSFDYSDRHVLVTGGSNGLGLAMAQGFRAAGATVTITGRRASAEEYDHDLSGFRYVACELADKDQVDSLVGGLDRLDVLVNNAGQNLARKGEWNPDVFEEALSINLAAVFRLSSACHDLLAAAPGWSSIVNLASMTSFQAVEVVPAYGAAKAGVVALTKSLALAWAPDQIRVNAIAPGLISTNMTAGMMSIDAAVAPTIARTPMARVGNPEDIAPVAMFLASEGASFLTGQTVAVDGGYLIKG